MAQDCLSASGMRKVLQKDDPTVTVKEVDENGDEFGQTIHISRINPKSATIVEMRALEAYTGVEKQNGFSSLPMGTGNMGLNDRQFHGYVQECHKRYEAAEPEEGCGILPVSPISHSLTRQGRHPRRSGRSVNN